jgi:hypothetical protein
MTARKDDIAGLAVASDERIEAYLLYLKDGIEQTEIVSLRSFIDDDGARLKQLLSRLRAQGMRTFRFPKVHPAEISKESLEMLGFRPAGGIYFTRRGRDRLEPSVMSPSRIVRAGSGLSGSTNVRADVGVAARLPPCEPGVSLRSPATDVPDVVRNQEPD